MIKDEYTIENDYPLMESINHYAKISNNDDYRYKFIEIMKRTTSERFRFLFKRTDKSDFGSKPLFRKKNWKK